MKKFSTYIFFVLLAALASAQVRYQQVLVQLENQSPLFASLHQKMEAEQSSVMAGSLLNDPEGELAYFWGTPSGTGNRWDLGVSQEFDFPTAYTHRKRIRSLLKANAEIDYKQQRMELLIEAQQLCADIVYYRSLCQFYSKCVAIADSLEMLFQRRFEEGDCNILEYNRVMLEASDTRNKLNMAEAEYKMLQQELVTLNGGNAIECNLTHYEPIQLPADFEAWYNDVEKDYPALLSASNKLEVSESEVRLTRAERLPHFSAGYASENEYGEAFRGVKVGVSLPLWQNRGQVQRAKAEQQLAKAELETAQSSLKNRMRGLYNKAMALTENASRLEQTFDQFGDTQLLRKAYESGEIPLQYYLEGIEFYNDAKASLLEVQRELEHVVIELFALR